MGHYDANPCCNGWRVNKRLTKMQTNWYLDKKELWDIGEIQAKNLLS